MIFLSNGWKKCLLILSFFFFLIQSSLAVYLLVPMDGEQKNHLKAYGMAYWTLEQAIEVKWLLNYRGGSFLIPYYAEIENECLVRGVSVEKIADVQSQ